jgi:hypothetical protein
VEKKARPMENTRDKDPGTQQKFLLALSTISDAMSKISS